MKLKLGLIFNFTPWPTQKRADLVFVAIIAMFFLAVLFFVWEGSILYRESFWKRVPPAPVIFEPVISGKDVDDILQMVDERANRFEGVLESR